MDKQVEWLINIKQIDIYFQIKYLKFIFFLYHIFLRYNLKYDISKFLNSTIEFHLFSFKIGKDQTQNTDTQIDTLAMVWYLER